MNIQAQQDRLVDPIHFFNSCGLAALSESFYLELIEGLRAENEKLTRLVERARARGLLDQG
ncbi:hypothetical protein [Pararhizobium qamdonense]|uniref:hypothetical protein n=1 Tax=Pararhizobium qamdonense TaxID=3031126 RepID=UPI0023E2C9D1|nr:hypothetical protein [Pararhizobium qamdonense]